MGGQFRHVNSLFFFSLFLGCFLGSFFLVFFGKPILVFLAQERGFQPCFCGFPCFFGKNCFFSTFPKKILGKKRPKTRKNKKNKEWKIRVGSSPQKHSGTFPNFFREADFRKILGSSPQKHSGTFPNFFRGG